MWIISIEKRKKISVRRSLEAKWTLYVDKEEILLYVDKEEILMKIGLLEDNLSNFEYLQTLLT